MTVCPLATRKKSDVDRHVLDRVELASRAENHALLVALDVDLEHRRHETAIIDELLGFLELDRNGLGGLACAVDDGGYIALAANGSGGPLADPIRAPQPRASSYHSWSWSFDKMS